MQSSKAPLTEQQEPEVLDADTLAAIDKSERWEPGNPGIPFDEALKRARAAQTERALQNDVCDTSKIPLACLVVHSHP